VRINSLPGRGTTVTVFLPRADAGAAPGGPSGERGMVRAIL
jgi:hypothetical protein